MGEPKIKINSNALRTPKPKKTLGLSVPPPLRLPHEDLITAEDEGKQKTSMPSRTSTPSPTRHSDNTQPPSQTSELQRDRAETANASTMPSLTSQTRHSLIKSDNSNTLEKNVSESAAPQRDFAKVANSITREAIPGGLFVGKSKQLYDCLYSLTRGAITPSRKIRISRPRLMKLAGIGSRVTFESNVERLCSVGLITVKQITGEHKGNEYTVFLPEEVDRSMPTLTSQTSQTSPAQKVDRLVSLETSQTSHSSSVIDSTVYEQSKTFFKTNTDDDNRSSIHTHTLEGFLKEIESAANRVGVDLSSISEAERTKWRELGELLAREFSEAAERTGVISSVPAFFAEHLRRLFARKDVPPATSRRLTEESAALPQETTGKKDIKLLAGRSGFTFEERREYAQNQRPPLGNGWMVESASGKYDEVIGEWLTTQSGRTAEPAADANSCPDCHGTNMYYPEGFEKGAAKCRHEKLTKVSGKKEARRLSRAEVDEQTLLLTELIEGGYTIEQAHKQFGADMHAEDWAIIEANITGRRESSKKRD